MLSGVCGVLRLPVTCAQVPRSFSCDAILRHGFPQELLCALRIIALRYTAEGPLSFRASTDAARSDIEAYSVEPRACRCCGISTGIRSTWSAFLLFLESFP
jgi:hypothetical protein